LSEDEGSLARAAASEGEGLDASFFEAFFFWFRHFDDCPAEEDVPAELLEDDCPAEEDVPAELLEDDCPAEEDVPAELLVSKVAGLAECDLVLPDSSDKRLSTKRDRGFSTMKQRTESTTASSFSEASDLRHRRPSSS
jgi:hypothetical protein